MNTSWIHRWEAWVAPWHSVCRRLGWMPKEPKLSLLDVHFDNAHTLWLTLPACAREQVPCFTPQLLYEMSSFLFFLKYSGACWHREGRLRPIHYIVMRSAHPMYFSLGGDVRYFHECIRRKDRSALHAYSLSCAKMIHEWYSHLQSHVTTIALVQGRALGGGFETILAADVIIAEEQSDFGFPETRFGLFPCSGGMSLLAHRVGSRQAEKMLSSTSTHSADTLLRLGLIDEMCPRGQGVNAVKAYIKKHAKNRSALLMLQRSRHRHDLMSMSEMKKVVDEWTALAMALEEGHLRVMEMILSMQAVQEIDQDVPARHSEEAGPSDNNVPHIQGCLKDA